MATNEELSPFRRLLSRAGSSLPAPGWDHPGDLGRMSVEAAIAQREEPRDRPSRGSLRLTGAGVVDNSAALEDIGSIATSWQRCVTAMGASLSGITTTRGRVPDLIGSRTRLLLEAAPSAGSVVLKLAASSDPVLETHEQGQAPIFDQERPLADTASESLLGLLAEAAATSSDDVDALTAHIRQLGPRVASNVRALADVMAKAHLDLDAAWFVPSAPSTRVTFSAVSAAWLRDFVTGRELDGEEVTISGTVRTVSDIAKWSIDSPEEGIVNVDASALTPEIVRGTTVGQVVSVRLMVRTQLRPDGSASTTYVAVELIR